ncbi:hypothetical protein CH373_12350 [Leptospira perolatii]|uniref:Glycosyltransferase 2-like domain-containing protein n=1 Tax=Leptospira perolatii TaxID=2023191 RepID=A0A2M9ZLI6_9LEPT|nr:glycosyltransferase family 2 protein [Leptospira perolatii]PJZ70272.1 hypothetical protein CH360_06620 [Leptospira perolatii]PJZ72844.1 hypothetical protein CH373_12350 [Leptospira perolatii]
MTVSSEFSVSYVVTTFNRGNLIQRTIDSILAQHAENVKFEVVVVDGGSTDDTTRVLERLYKADLRVKVVQDPSPGVMPSRHTGAKNASGSIIVFIEDDVKLEQGHLGGVVSAFSNEEIHLAGGPCLPEFRDCEAPDWFEGLWSRVDGIEGGKMCGWLSLIDLGSKPIQIDPTLIWALNLAIRRSTLFELGGFHPDLSPPKFKAYQGDGEVGLALKACEKGLKAVYSPNMKVWHEITAERFTLQYLEKRFYFQGISESYTKIRKERSVKFPIKEIIKFLYFTLLKVKHVFSKEPLKKVFIGTQIAYAKGYIFHNRATKHSDHLRRWIFQNNYLEQNVPSI